MSLFGVPASLAAGPVRAGSDHLYSFLGVAETPGNWMVHKSLVLD